MARKAPFRDAPRDCAQVDRDVEVASKFVPYLASRYTVKIKGADIVAILVNWVRRPPHGD